MLRACARAAHGLHRAHARSGGGALRRTRRCAATEVNPATAERDAKPPKWLLEHYGHADLGIYAEVLEGGRVAVGDALELP